MIAEAQVQAVSILVVIIIIQVVTVDNRQNHDYQRYVQLLTPPFIPS